MIRWNSTLEVMLLGQHLRFPGIDVIFMDFCRVKISPKAGRQAAFPQNCGLLTSGEGECVVSQISECTN